jgi:hypothetical protein
VSRRKNEPLPPPLPPDRRTVGQLVAETLRIYGHNVPAALAIGVAPAVIDAVAAELTRVQALVVVPLLGGLLLTLAYIAASAVVLEVRPDRGRVLVALVVGVLVFVPFPFLASVFVLPGLVWLAFLGLAVPAAVKEGSGIRGSLARGVELGRADFVHALGSLATLAILVFLTRVMLSILLRDLGDTTTRIAGLLADVVISPLLFLGAALLYVDQAARVRSPSADD